jgi:hypothetical protein
MNDPKQDPFKPPEVPVLVFCLHCESEFMSSDMVYEKRNTPDRLWFCPNPQCSGGGFGFDIFPINQKT